MFKEFDYDYDSDDDWEEEEQVLKVTRFGILLRPNLVYFVFLQIPLNRVTKSIHTESLGRISF